MEALADLHAPLVYASLLTIATSGILILTGVVLVLLGYQDWHKRAMLTASAFALVFVMLYLVKSSLYPPRGYAGDHRKFYFFVLWSHTALAALNLPVAGYTIYLGLKERLDRHRKIAPFTAGVWIYVAITGWMIYFFLH
jgi:putative membrane protein